jgi:hypothetical protein
MAGHHIQWIGSFSHVFGRVNSQRQQARKHSCQQAGQCAAEQSLRTDEDGMRRDRKERPDSDYIPSCCTGGYTSQCHGNRATRLPFEEQQLHSEQDRGDWRSKSSGHARRGARHQQGFSLGIRQVKELRDHGTERTAGHDNGTFRAEGSARTDRDGGGKRLQNRQARLYPAAVDQDGFKGLRDAVTADALGAIARHKANHQRTRHGYEQGPPPEMITGRRD